MAGIRRSNLSGGPQVVYWVAVAEGPVTAAEIAPLVDISEDAVFQHMEKCWKHGMMLRRPRVDPDRASGKAPLEYVLKLPHENDDGEQELAEPPEVS